MNALWRHDVRRRLGAALGWGVILGALAGAMAAFYDTVAQAQAQFAALLAAYPEALLAFFTAPDLAVFTPAGFLHAEIFSYLPFLLGFHAALVGANLIREDEARGVLDVLLARPISRQAFFAARVLAALSALVVILACLAVGLWVGQAIATHVDLTWTAVLRALAPVAVQWLVVFALALALSLVLPTRGQAAALTLFALVVAFFAPPLARLRPELEPWARLSPLWVYPGGRALVTAPAWSEQGLWLGVSALVLAFALWRFVTRDVRVRGEGRGRWPWARGSRPRGRGPQ